LVVSQSSSQIPEGLMNNPAFVCVLTEDCRVFDNCYFDPHYIKCVCVLLI